jgi:hypothetical protein
VSLIKRIDLKQKIGLRCINAALKEDLVPKIRKDILSKFCEVIPICLNVEELKIFS